MESFFLKLIGDVIRPKESEHFWANGYYCWFINDREKKTSFEQRVYITSNGIVVFEDCSKGQKFRVSPK